MSVVAGSGSVRPVVHRCVVILR